MQRPGGQQFPAGQLPAGQLPAGQLPAGQLPAGQLPAGQRRLVVTDLSFRYAGQSRNALSHVNLTVAPGEMVLVTGPSGCGKSTLSLVLAGLAPSRVAGRLAGSVLLGEENISSLEPAQAGQRVGLVFQNPNLQLFHQMVEAEIAFGPENLRLPRQIISERVDASLRRTGATALRKAATFTLSGGEKQRVAIAATLAMEPEVLVLDEPLSDLDPVGAQDVLRSLEALRDERRLAIVLIEHRVDEVLEHVDRVVLLDDGRVVLDRPAADAFADAGPWLAAGVALPEVIQVARGLPEIFTGALPLSVTQAAAVLAASPGVVAGAARPGAPEHSTAGHGAAGGGRMAAESAPVTGDPAQAEEPGPPDGPALAGGQTPGGERASRAGEAAAGVWAGVSLSLGGRQVLDGASLVLHQGEWLALIGANGSGKTTLAGLAVGFEAPDRGSVEIGGAAVRKGSVAAQAERVGFLLQAADEMLFCNSVDDELTFGPRYRRAGVSGAEPAAAGRRSAKRTRLRIMIGSISQAHVLKDRPNDEIGHSGELSQDELLAVLGLQGLGARSPWQLSQGQRQRLALGALLAGAPDLLILDEPTTGQDTGHARAFMTWLEQLRERHGLTYLMITHDMRAVARYASRVAVMAGGRILATGTPAEIFARTDVLTESGIIAPPIARLHLRLAASAGAPPPAAVHLDVQSFLDAVRPRLAPV
ncbi:MAG TPA: ATP-binding cassette domain-containing protein [Streptosporangiaceae bacterium]|nr:ATP-binding cassette domain-containing protein [Streptosporangiaceae bacterium]